MAQINGFYLCYPWKKAPFIYVLTTDFTEGTDGKCLDLCNLCYPWLSFITGFPLFAVLDCFQKLIS